MPTKLVNNSGRKITVNDNRVKELLSQGFQYANDSDEPQEEVISIEEEFGDTNYYMEESGAGWYKLFRGDEEIGTARGEDKAREKLRALMEADESA